MKVMTNKRAVNHLRLVSPSTDQSQNLFAVPSRPRYSPGFNSSSLFDPIIDTLKRHWPEYLMEAWGLGLFMISAISFAILLQHPSSPVRQAIPNATMGKVLT